MIEKIVGMQLKAFDWLHHHWESPPVIKMISNIVIAFFILGLVIASLAHFGWLSSKHVSAFYAIELAFNVLLVFEVLGLVFIIPHSVADSVGKQFEIVSLLLLRDAFKEFGHYLGQIHWDISVLWELAPIITDAFGAIILFLITGIFYRSQKHVKITRNNQEQQAFIKIKKQISIYLAVSFVAMGLYELFSKSAEEESMHSLKLFYNLLIFTDIFILLFSLRYNTKYYNLFRYSSFALATVFLRLTLSAPAYYNVSLSLIAGLMVLLVTFIYNRLLIKPEQDLAGNIEP